MVRTIQHPGVQIQESEIGGYRSTVVMNNAYIMGFADRGPIYDYSWITTTKEFTKIYGEPQTEAEKYLFIAVQSVLQNGGTPIVARMPYDNKQCKAYKAMKIKWADATPLVDTDLSTPVVPLTDVKARVDYNKDLSAIFTVKSVTVNDTPVDQDFLESLTVTDLLKQLNPYEEGSEKSDGRIYDDFIYGLKVNGVYPSGLNVSQEAVRANVQAAKSDFKEATVKVVKYDAGYNRVINESLDLGHLESARFISEQLFSDDSTRPLPICDVYVSIPYGKQTYMINMFSTESAPSAADGDSGATFFMNANDIPSDLVAGLSAAIAEIEPSLPASSIIGDKATDGAMPLILIDRASSVNSLTVPLSGLGDSVLAPYREVGGILAVFAHTVKGNLIVKPYYIDPATGKKRPFYTANEASVVREMPQMAMCFRNGAFSLPAYKALFVKAPEVDPSQVHGLFHFSASSPETGTMRMGPLLPVYTNTSNGRFVDSTGSLGDLVSPSLPMLQANRCTLLGFVNADVETPAVSGFISAEEVKSMVETNGDRPAFALGEFAGETGYPVFSKQNFSKAGDNDPFAEFYGEDAIYANEDVKAHRLIDLSLIGEAGFSNSNWQKFGSLKGDVTFEKSIVVSYMSSSSAVPALSINDDAIVQGDEIGLYVKTIYNNPYFLDLDEDNYTAIEASLMLTPEMGFKYGLFLDSEDCEISNDQYDDLVTVNQFKAVDRSVDKYGQDIDDANFIIVDKQKTVVQGAGGNVGYFTTIIDPFDALKVQRLLVSPAETDPTARTVSGRETDGSIVTKEFRFDHSQANIANLDYWAYESADAWNQIYEDILDSMDCLQRVRNADGVYIGEPNPIDKKTNILDSWSIPLTGGFYDESISKTLMRKFPGIPMANVSSDDLSDPDFRPSIIDHNYMTHICVAVCKTTIDQSNGKIVVQLVETFFGSLFNEKNLQNGRSLFIGDIINANSDFIEFYRNNYVSAGEKGAYDPPEYRRADVNQIFIRDSEDLKNAAQLRGIDYEEYGCDALDPAVREEALAEYYRDLEKVHIYAIDKKEVCLYNLHWEANLTSFSKKESQKVIANTSNLYSVNDGTTANVAKNFLVDMDRCIKFIKNIDDIPLHFICDAGLSTIAQFCDNVVWNPNKRSVVGEQVDVYGKKTGVKKYVRTGGWITQPFDPDNDPDGEDRYITGYEDVSTWRRVVEKITSIAGEIRKDCFAIIDAPRHLTLDGAAPKIRRTKFTNNFDKAIGRNLRYISGLNSSYVAGYYNWLRTTDQYSGKSIWIPPTSKIIGNYCYLNINNLPWLAPAGLTYGTISGCHAISHNPDYQEEDQIYMKSWNYIKQYPLEGLVVEGQRTLLGKESVFERVNVRLLFLDLERFAYNVSRTFKYQVNNTYTREQFVQTLKPKFEDYTLRGGIYEYLIKVDSENNTPETIDANELRGDIFIKPARLIEFVLLSFVGTSTATDFTELQLG